jgi:uroporphyrinogen-III decarboxylase
LRLSQIPPPCFISQLVTVCPYIAQYMTDTFLLKTPKMMHELDLDMLPFVGEALGILRKEVGDSAAVLGFVGAPWTLATYIVEGGSSSTYKTIKSMALRDPETLKAILSKVADAIGDYVGYQIDAGAQCVQIFDSWGGQLPPAMWEVWSKPYIEQVVDKGAGLSQSPRPAFAIAHTRPAKGRLLSLPITLTVYVIHVTRD